MADERPPVDPLLTAARIGVEACIRHGHYLHVDDADDALRAALASPAAPRPEGLEPWQVSIIHDAADCGIIGARLWRDSLSDTGDTP